MDQDLMTDTEIKDRVQKQIKAEKIPKIYQF